MENAVLDRCEEFRYRSQNARDVTYTQLARGRKWRAALSEEGVLRVTGS